MEIRRFREDDRDGVVALWVRCGLVVPWNNPNLDIDRKLKVGAELFVVGEHDGQLMAAAMGGYEGHRGWVNYLAVAPEWRGRGYARQLMEWLEQRLIEMGCPKINLQIRNTNLDVVRFYQALGYKEDACIALGKRLIPD